MTLIEEIKSLSEVPCGKCLLILMTYIARLLMNIPGSFIAYADAMKGQFNMTQTQVTIAEATLTTSAMFLVPAGLIYKACSILNTSLVFLLLTIFGWTSVWLCVVLRNHLIGYSSVIYIAMVIAGHARTYVPVLSNVYMPTLIDSKYHHFLIASLDLTQQFGVFMTSLIYESLFINGHIVDTEKQSLESFMLLVLITDTIVGCLWAAAISLGQRYQRGNLERDDQQPTTSKVQETTKKLTKTFNQKATPSSSSQTLQTSQQTSQNVRFPLPFILIIASTAVPVAILIFQSTNVSYMTRSLSLIHLNYFLVTFYRISTFIGALLLYFIIFWGTKYAYINEIISVISSILLVIVQIFQILYLIKGSDSVYFCVSYIINSTLLGAFKLHTTLLLNNYYRNDNFGFKYSFAWSFVCILLAVLHVTFGALYDSEIPAGGGQYCYGPICLTNTFILTTALAVLALISSILLLYIKYRMLNVDDASQDLRDTEH